MYKTLLLFCACCIGHMLSAQTIYYVNQNAGGAGTGSSWTDAFIRLQQALAVAQNGDQIWVAKGTYKPTTGNDRFVYFNLPSGVAVYGGFTGTETTLGQRNWTTNPTILSGDIGAPGDTTDNSFNILYTYSPNNKTRLDGLIFEEGNANNPDPAADAHRPTRSGGGVYVDGENFGYAELTLEHCIFRRNRAFYQGGALYANGREGGMAIVRMDDCIFEYNYAQYGGSGFAQESYWEQPYPLNVSKCVFIGNEEVAVWLRTHQPVSFQDCSFTGNSSAISFTLMDRHYPIKITNCNFINHGKYAFQYSTTFAESGDPNITFSNCKIIENEIPFFFTYVDKKLNLTFKNTIFDRNFGIPFNFSSDLIVVQSSNDSSLVNLVNCLFHKNARREIRSNVNTRLTNTILIRGPEELNLFKGFFSGGGNLTVSHCLINYPECDSLASPGPNTPVQCDSTNLFNLDPQFTDPSQSDFQLLPCSPAINAGLNEILDSLNIYSDLNGQPRIANNKVDIGPYERFISINATQSEASPCPGDNSGAIFLNHELCQPVEVMWDNGDTTGTELTGLAAGVYSLTVTGANNVAITDTVVISEPAPIVMNPIIHHVSCYGGFDGWIDGNASGGTPPYTYLGTGSSPWFPFNLQVGTYFVTVTDALGCTATTAATITSPDPFQWHYSIQNASCATCSDGSIVFDSISGGVNPPTPDPIWGLAPGNYAATVTDAAGCYAILQYTIGVTVSTEENSTQETCQFGPNPTPAGSEALFQNLENEPITMNMLSSHGALLSTQIIAAKQRMPLKALWPPGVYWLDCRSENGRRWLVKWVIF